VQNTLDPAVSPFYIRGMLEADPLAGIRYISIDTLQSRTIGEFKINPDIRLPIEIPADHPDWSPENIRWEAIISAMLKLLACRPEHENAAYYRQFILAVNPQIKEEFTQVGILKSRQGELDLAIEIFKALVGVFPDCPASRNNLALAYEEKARQLEAAKQPKEAETYSDLAFQEYKRAVSENPESAASHLNFGHFYLKRRNLHKAKKHIDKFLALNRDPKRTEQTQALSRGLDELDRIESACSEAFDAIKMGRENVAIEKMQNLSEKHPTIWNIWFLLGWAQRKAGLYAGGKSSLEKAIELDPGNSDTLNELAICLMELGDFKNSKSHLLEALKIEPENVKILSNLGILSMKTGQHEEAAAYFKRVVEHHPEDPLALRYLEILS